MWMTYCLNFFIINNLSNADKNSRHNADCDREALSGITWKLQVAECQQAGNHAASHHRNDLSRIKGDADNVPVNKE
jgi:hypothetical protein